MNNKHLFTAQLNWQKDANKAMSSKKSHTLHIKGKADIAMSAAKAFKGDPTLYNPEDLLLSSLVSCHFMSYLYVCTKHAIDIISYTDEAEGILAVNENGSGQFVEVTLRPTVVISDSTKIDLANLLHQEANQLCFIANSCNFIIKHEATCKTL